jgi:predicted DNA binding CopG/RHH family protein
MPKHYDSRHSLSDEEHDKNRITTNSVKKDTQRRIDISLELLQQIQETVGEMGIPIFDMKKFGARQIFLLIGRR